MWITSPVEKNITVMWRCESTLFHVWRRKLVKPESDTCDQHPPENTATSQVVWLSRRAIFANISQIYLLFCFWGNCVQFCICLLQLGSICNMCVHHNMRSMCTRKKLAVPAWNLLLFLHGPNIIITWVMQFINFQACCMYNHHEQTSQ